MILVYLVPSSPHTLVRAVFYGHTLEAVRPVYPKFMKDHWDQWINLPEGMPRDVANNNGGFLAKGSSGELYLDNGHRYPWPGQWDLEFFDDPRDAYRCDLILADSGATDYDPEIHGDFIDYNDPPEDAPATQPPATTPQPPAPQPDATRPDDKKDYPGLEKMLTVLAEMVYKVSREGAKEALDDFKKDLESSLTPAQPPAPVDLSEDQPEDSLDYPELEPDTLQPAPDDGEVEQPRLSPPYSPAYSPTRSPAYSPVNDAETTEKFEDLPVQPSPVRPRTFITISDDEDEDDAPSKKKRRRM